jgi:hypothetical protein
MPLKDLKTADELAAAIEAIPMDGANEILRLRKFEEAWQTLTATLVKHANHEGPMKYLVAYETAAQTL